MAAPRTGCRDLTHNKILKMNLFASLKEALTEGVIGQIAAQNDEKPEKIQKAFEILGKKWSGLVLYTLLEDPMRFTDIRRNIPELSDRVLAERLKELERLQLVKRNVYTRIPVKVEYELTKKGKELEKSMREIEIWAENNL